jgi:hypothetical protein
MQAGAGTPTGVQQMSFRWRGHHQAPDAPLANDPLERAPQIERKTVRLSILDVQDRFWLQLPAIQERFQRSSSENPSGASSLGR